MRVLCAYSNLRPRTRKALEQYAPQADFVDVSGDDLAYWRAICERWTGEDDLLVVEHDIEIHDQVIPEFEACGEPWCSFAYKLWEPDVWCYNALGCTKFSAALQREVSTGEIQQIQAQWLAPSLNAAGDVEYNPEIMPATADAQCRCGGKGSPPCWRHIDMKIADTLEGRGPLQRGPYLAHVHTPPVVHLPIEDPDEHPYRVAGFPFEFDGKSRIAQFPHQEPTRVFHSDTLAERPEWWPARPAGVTVTVPAAVRRPVGDMLTMSEAEAGGLFLTDKIYRHGYFPAYQRICGQIGPAGRVCEIGVWRGDSLPMWQAFFPDGKVAGVDADPAAAWAEGTVRIVSWQDDESLPARLETVSPGGWDLIVDDASHEGAKTRRTWELLWPLVAPGGWYVIEDWQIGLGVPPWNSDDDSMLRCAESFLPLLTSKDADPEFIEYRCGLIIMRKRAGR